jgi:hypothetical protein
MVRRAVVGKRPREQQRDESLTWECEESFE